MRDSAMPAVGYDATAVRPAWNELPPELRSAISGRLGSPVARSTTATSGFTRGFAAVLESTGGERAFVKAASLTRQPELSDWYAREAAITAALPDGVPAARPRWTMTAAGHVVVCFEALPGGPPRLPWQPTQLEAALAAWARAAAALRHPPPELLAVGLPELAPLLRSDLSHWTAVQCGRTEPPPAPPYAAARLAELAALERALPGYARGAGVIHGDLRLDNVLIDPTGAAWLCDWTWPCLGPAWFDTASLLVTAYASGLDADRLFRTHPTAADAPPDALDATLAALAGHWLRRAAGPPTDASPHLRDHQLFSGRAALSWLASRRGWA